MEYVEEIKTERWLILSDKDQKFPTTPLIVVDAREQDTMKGIKMPVLTLEDEDGNKYKMCGWKRDVKNCIDQYGSKTEQWGEVQFTNKNGRWILEPAPMRVKEEQVE